MPRVGTPPAHLAAAGFTDWDHRVAIVGASSWTHCDLPRDLPRDKVQRVSQVLELPIVPNLRLEMSQTEQIISPARMLRHFPVCSLILLVVLINSSIGLAQTSVNSAKPLGPEPFPLSRVRLLAGPFKERQDLDARYLLMVEPDRLLAGFSFCSEQQRG